ncbi:MAG: 2-deoxy-D-gluconate 3-dehydrogenase [Rhodospirillaceae bacterium]|nr:2-deoxy-D-gluconate 3-dehydrogenase [Rhodospirillaceae bacterium]|tara:strand:+ start:1150 stop:1917 length:768 start_codon:yes stop_codon:yes gene_type:complete
MTSIFDLTGRVAVITGGNGGIGLGMAKGLAQAGASIAIIGRNPEKNALASKKLKELGANVLAIEKDITQESAPDQAISTAQDYFGRIDILINNAGSNIRKRPEELSSDDFRWVLETNLTSAFLFSQAVYPAMKKASQGKIINIGSMYSIFGAPAVTAYSVSKGGIVQMTKSMAAAWAPDKIQVNAVLPGWIDTELTQQARAQIEGLYERQLARIPDGRWGTPEDHAGVAVFLASSASDYVTGTAIPVDGGFSISG